MVDTDLIEDFMHSEKKKNARIKATMIVASVITPKIMTKSLRAKPCSAHTSTSIVLSPDSLSSALLLQKNKTLLVDPHVIFLLSIGAAYGQPQQLRSYKRIAGLLRI